MGLAIVLSLMASLCTATASVCQRLGARNLERSTAKAGGFDLWLVFRLARQPAWLLGFACMLAGFVFQITALHFGPLALVQPILAVELLFVFGYLALLPGPREASASGRDWLAAAAMSVGIGIFLRAAAPTGGRPSAPAGLWWLAAVVTTAAVAIAIALSRAGAPTVGPGPGPGPGADVEASSSRRAACLGIATGIAWGFVAAIIKELSSRMTNGPSAIFSNWAVYALMIAGAAAMLLTSHAMAAGPLAASQPGFTVLDPVTATLLGVFMFGEHVATTPRALTVQVLGLVLLVAGVRALTRSKLITGPPGHQPSRAL